jgi:Helix-hairpin-helix motif
MELRTKRSWRLEHSWWLFVILLSVGLLSWASFVYLGIRTKRQRWTVWGVVYGIAVWGGLLVVGAVDEDSWLVLVGAIGWIGGWAGSFIHGLAIRDEVLDRLSVDEDIHLRDARSRVVAREVGAELARNTPVLAREAGVGEGDGFGGLVDVNHADAALLATIPGFTPDLGVKVVELRNEVGGFDSVLDFATILDLPPRLLDSIRDRLVCLPRQN